MTQFPCLSLLGVPWQDGGDFLLDAIPVIEWFFARSSVVQPAWRESWLGRPAAFRSRRGQAADGGIATPRLSEQDLTAADAGALRLGIPLGINSS